MARSDDRSEMNSRRPTEGLSTGDADALLSGRSVAGHDEWREILGLMRKASAVPAPTPTAALADVLHHGFDPLPVESMRSGSRWGRWSARIAVVTAAAMTATVGAATANALPAPIQTAVANVVGAVRPLQLPRPEKDSNDRGGADDRAGEAGNPDSEADQPSAERAETASTPAPSGPQAPAAAPPQSPRTTTPTTDEIDEPAPEADEGHDDAPDTEEADDHGPDTEDAGSDVPETDPAQTGSENPDAGDG